MKKWFSKKFWEYLLAPKNPDYKWLTVLRCRLNEHNGFDVVWHNINGKEPDMTCRGCGDWLG